MNGCFNLNKSGLSLKYYFWFTTFRFSGVVVDAVAVPFLAAQQDLPEDFAAHALGAASSFTITPVAVASPGAVADADAVPLAAQQDLPEAIWSLVQAGVVEACFAVQVV